MFDSFGWVSFSPHTKVAAFAEHLKEGRVVAARCGACGRETFPPRADCERCLSDEFELFPLSGRGHVVTFTKIVAAPAGFEDRAPYVLGVVDLEECGRALAWFGDSEAEDEIRIGMEVQLVPRIQEVRGTIRCFYTLERPDEHVDPVSK
jgi:uncharacterized OB-fold protein